MAAKKTSKKKLGKNAAAKKKVTKRPAKEPIAKIKQRARRILAGLAKIYPDADCALRHDSAIELLVATILSAQSTDETVNKVTPVLFAKYPTARDIAGATSDEIERIIHSTGFFRQKTRSIQNACRIIAEDFGGHVPDTMDDLLTLPGVARKTANVVLGTWFNKNEGIAVDTHVGRLATRMGLTRTAKNEKDARNIERDLMELVPRDKWTFFGHAMIWHGRRVCSARRPNCEGCAVSTSCPSAFSFPPTGAAKATAKQPAK